MKHYTSENVRDRITRNYKNLVECLDQTDMIRAELFSNGILSMEEYEYMQREYNNKGRIASNRLLLKTLLNKSEEELLQFAETLADNPANELLLKIMEDQVSADIDMETNASVEQKDRGKPMLFCISLFFFHSVHVKD